MARHAVPPPPLRGRPFRGTTAVRQGLISRRQLQSKAFRRLFRDVYADAVRPVDHTLRCHGAALILPRGAAIGGRSAAHLHGAGLLTGDDPVSVVVPRARRFGPVTGLRITVAALVDADRVPGRCVTTPMRTAWDLARLDPVDAVVHLDALLGRGVLRAADLPAVLARYGDQRGRSRAARAFGMTDGRSESPQESRLRVRLTLAGLRPHESQFEVRTAIGEFVARVDLAWPAHRLAVEYDGAWHAGAEQLRRDRRRLNRLLGAGWCVLHVTADRLARDLAEIVEEIRAALARPL